MWSKDLVVIFLFSRDLCAMRSGQLSSVSGGNVYGTFKLEYRYVCSKKKSLAEMQRWVVDVQSN